MRTFGRMSVALALGLFAGAVALAQVKEVPGERVTGTGTVEAIDHKARVLTLKNKKGDLVTIDMAAAVFGTLSGSLIPQSAALLMMMRSPP